MDNAKVQKWERRADLIPNLLQHKKITFMVTTIIDNIRWFGFGKKPLVEQENPTHEQLLAFPAEETGNTIADYPSYDAERDQLPEGQNTRTYAVDSPEGRTSLILVPDPHGWYVENGAGHKWRPKDLDELRYLLEEMDFQIERYGGLL